MVTDASSGLGREFCLTLARVGYNIAAAAAAAAPAPRTDPLSSLSTQCSVVEASMRSNRFPSLVNNSGIRDRVLGKKDLMAEVQVLGMEYLMAKFHQVKLRFTTIVAPYGARTSTSAEHRIRRESQTGNAQTSAAPPLAETRDALNAEDGEQRSRTGGQNDQHGAEERPQRIMSEEQMILKKVTKIAAVTTPLSAASITGIGVLFIVSKMTHQYVLGCAELLLFLSVMCGVAILSLWAFCCDPPNMSRLVRILVWILAGLCIAGTAGGVLLAAGFFIARMF